MSGRSTRSGRRDPHALWPALSSWQTRLTQGNVRLSDAEREHAARLLGDHYASGRLDHDAYAERLDTTFAARTWGDLAPLFRDLPTHPRAARPSGWSAPATRPSPAPVRPASTGFPTFALLLVLVGVGMLTNVWVFVAGLGVLLLARRTWRERARARGQAIGSRRVAGGNWS